MRFFKRHIPALKNIFAASAWQEKRRDNLYLQLNQNLLGDAINGYDENSAVALIEKGVAKENSFFCAIHKGRYAAVEALLKSGFDANKEYASFVPLHEAARHGDIEIAKLLIQNGADINKPNKFGETPLTSALHDSNGLAMMDFLIAQGAQVNAVSQSGTFDWVKFTALDIADVHCKQAPEMTQRLIDAGALRYEEWVAHGEEIAKALADAQLQKRVKEAGNTVLETPVETSTPVRPKQRKPRAGQ